MLVSVDALKQGHSFPKVSKNISWSDTKFKVEKLSKLECDISKLVWKMLSILLKSGSKWDKEIAATQLKLF